LNNEDLEISIKEQTVKDRRTIFTIKYIERNDYRALHRTWPSTRGANEKSEITL